MSRETSKEVTIGEHSYKITSMDPFEGSWLVSNFPKLAPMLGINLKDEDGAEVESSPIGPDEFKKIQELCLSKIQRLQDDGKPPIAIYVNHKFAFRDLDDDTMTIHKLTIASLAFGLDPFFAEAASKAASQTSLDTNL